MRAHVRMLLAAGLVLGAALRAQAAVSVGVDAGAQVGGPDEIRAAPAMGLEAGWRGRRFLLAGSLSGWTLPSRADAAGRTEMALGAAAGLTGAISGRWRWSLAGGPALVMGDTALAGAEWTPAVVFAPGVELATRRRTLAVDLGLRAYAGADLWRVGARAGVRYTF